MQWPAARGRADLPKIAQGYVTSLPKRACSVPDGKGGWIDRWDYNKPNTKPTNGGPVIKTKDPVQLRRGKATNNSLRRAIVPRTS